MIKAIKDFLPMKGSTAYEFQFRQHYWRFVHLKGGSWKTGFFWWTQSSRLSYRIDETYGTDWRTE